MVFDKNKTKAAIIDFVDLKKWNNKQIVDNLDMIFDHLLSKGLVKPGWRGHFNMAATVNYHFSQIKK